MVSQPTSASTPTELWAGDFGRDYTARNPHIMAEMDELYRQLYGLSADTIWRSFIWRIPKDTSILEVGCGSGTNLLLLQSLGYTDLTGIDIQPAAVEAARASDLQVFEGSVLSLPFLDRSFDLVLTAGLLIHIPPADLLLATAEIRRCSSQLIMGLEYWAEDWVEVPYRNQQQLCWKGPYETAFPGTRTWYWKKIPYREGTNVDIMYLLEVE